jgi:hypothetical protein
MEIETIIQLAVLLGLPIIWPLILAFYISKKASVIFKVSRFFLYSISGYVVMILFFVLALAFESWLISSGYTCNNPETVSFKALCSNSFLSFSSWYQSYLFYIPLWGSLVFTTMAFKRYASI